MLDPPLSLSLTTEEFVLPHMSAGEGGQNKLKKCLIKFLTISGNPSPFQKEREEEKT
jgi:hypothetical protein